jgi:hypothetical protein
MDGTYWAMATSGYANYIVDLVKETAIRNGWDIYETLAGLKAAYVALVFQIQGEQSWGKYDDEIARFIQELDRR